ncbi:MAG TPA: hypothetical protein RMH99_09920 [Sandaracinaceae bacterium LLY-WYZ-13_1]|nr:hypothetical protein [Sandaracinaceae bacterium LLY-WYZ-13_1]
MARRRRPSKALLWLTIVAAPAALAVETGLRLLLFPEDFELVRELLNPTLTPVAWVLGGVAGIAAWVGLLVQRRISRRRLAKLPADADDEARFAAVFGVFLLTTAVPQIPAIFSTFAYMFGASLVPVLVGIGLCSVGVVAQALRVSSLAEDAVRGGGRTSAVKGRP